MLHILRYDYDELILELICIMENLIWWKQNDKIYHSFSGVNHSSLYGGLSVVAYSLIVYRRLFSICAPFSIEKAQLIIDIVIDFIGSSLVRKSLFEQSIIIRYNHSMFV